MSVQQGGLAEDGPGRTGRLGVYDPDLVCQVAVNLFRAWPYSAYREAERLRADDQLIRAKAAWLLGLARAAVLAADDAYRRERLPPPTEAQPYPDAAAVADTQSVERLGRTLSALLAQLNALPTPPSERLARRHREDATTLAALADCDAQLIGQAELLRISLEAKPGAWIVANLASLTPGLAAIGAILCERAERLVGAQPTMAAQRVSS